MSIVTSLEGLGWGYHHYESSSRIPSLLSFRRGPAGQSGAALSYSDSVSNRSNLLEGIT